MVKIHKNPCKEEIESVCRNRSVFRKNKHLKKQSWYVTRFEKTRLKNVNNTHSRFLNCTNGTKSCKASHLFSTNLIL